MPRYLNGKQKASDQIKVTADVRHELAMAMEAHLPLNSVHEAYAIILEELDEFWEEVRKNQKNRSPDNMRLELTQIAAMACRAMIDLNLLP